MARDTANLLGSILLVEDDAVLAMLTQEQLLDAGAKDVSICSAAADALKALAEQRFDAVIIDVHLADSDEGWEIAELLDVIGPRPPRIIFATGTPQDIPERYSQLGTVLEKPYDHDHLIGLLRKPRKHRILKALRLG